LALSENGRCQKKAISMGKMTILFSDKPIKGFGWLVYFAWTWEIMWNRLISGLEDFDYQSWRMMPNNFLIFQGAEIETTALKSVNLEKATDSGQPRFLRLPMEAQPFSVGSAGHPYTCSNPCKYVWRTGSFRCLFSLFIVSLWSILNTSGPDAA
jgi:hypothetical protein